MNKVITIRTIFDRADLARLGDEPEFRYSTSLRAKLEAKPAHDQFLAVFTFEAESRLDGMLILRPISTTVLGIQRYSTKRLQYQGIFTADSEEFPILYQTLRAHFRAGDRDVHERMCAISGPKLRWTRQFPNGAGDLANPEEFELCDPDIAALDELFSRPDPRPSQDDHANGERR